MAKYDVEKIKAAVTLSAIINKYVPLKPNGVEFQACCPFHKEKTPSFTVSDTKGFYYCFGCGANGDVIDFIEDYHSCSFTDACKILGGTIEAPDAKPMNIDKVVIPGVYDGYEIIKPPHTPEADEPFRLYNPKRNKWTTYRPSAVYNYGDFFVLRIEMPGGKKITPVVAYVTSPVQDDPHWSHHPAGDKRPLYEMHNRGKQILIVEGEKAAQACHRLVGNLVDVMTWCGGGKAWKKTEWELIFGREVILWPDADKPGIETMHDIGQRLLQLECKVKIIEVPNDRDGWDAADAEDEKWTEKKVIKWAKDNVVDQEIESIQQPELNPVREEEPPPYDESEMPPSDESPAPEPPKETPFRMLGFNHGKYYYLPKGTQQLCALSTSHHGQLSLLGLAPLSFWFQMFPKGKTQEVNWSVAADSMLRASEKVGVFDINNDVRGVGAWLDRGRVVMHMGNITYVDGVPTQPNKVESRYIYQAGPSLGLEIGESLTTEKGKDFVKLIKKLSWENPLSGDLLPGWIVSALICGILDWIPHIAIHGPAGSGKSTVMNYIIANALGPLALSVEGTTTEAGIRQTLGQDARPVLFDEFDAETYKEIERTKSILGFARVSSSGGGVAKGGTDGQQTIYRAHAAFCFSSINSNASQFADQSRITQMVLTADTREDGSTYYEKLSADIKELITPEFAAALLARKLKNIDSILANAKSFTEAAHKVLGSRRIADQIGIMLAGTYSLCMDIGTRITPQAAEEWIKGRDWGDHTVINQKPDPERLLDKICTYRVSLMTRRGPTKPSIGELILRANRVSDSSNIQVDDEAISELAKHGIKCEVEGVTIGNSCDPLKKILAETPWHSEWGRPLRELPGAVACGNTYFSVGIRCRGTTLPIELFTE